MTGKELAEAIGNFVNGADSKDIDTFVEAMINNVHRTLQQNTMKMFVRLVQKYAQLPDSHYDLRNEATVQLCKKIVERLDKYDLALPLI